MTKNELMNFPMRRVIAEYEARVKKEFQNDKDKLTFISGFNYAITLLLDFEESDLRE